MMKLAWMLTALAVSTVAQPDIAGVWESNAPTHVLTKIARVDSGLDVTVRANGLDQFYHLEPGRPTDANIRGVAVTAEGKWDATTVEIRLHAMQQGHEFRITSHYTLSSDGSGLRNETTSQQDTQPERRESRDFERRALTAWAKEPPVEPAEMAYRNIQVMKGVPSPKLPEVMTNLTKWLGVKCDHCHDTNHYESDEKPAKQTARTMFKMVRALNSASFPQTNAVTCWTCHRGATKPESLPPAK